jgi:hypothetical protein
MSKRKAGHIEAAHQAQSTDTSIAASSRTHDEIEIVDDHGE